MLAFQVGFVKKMTLSFITKLLVGQIKIVSL